MLGTIWKSLVTAERSIFRLESLNPKLKKEVDVQKWVTPNGSNISILFFEGILLGPIPDLRTNTHIIFLAIMFSLNKYDHSMVGL